MKIQFISLSIAVLACISCNDDNSAEKETMKKEVDEAIDATQDYFTAEKNNLREEVIYMKQDAKAKITVLEERIENFKNEGRDDSADSLNYTKNQLQEADRKLEMALEDIKNKSMEEFKATKADIKALLNKTEREIDNAGEAIYNDKTDTSNYGR